MGYAPQPHHPPVCSTVPVPSEIQLRYAEDDGHRFHPPPQYARFSVHHHHSLFQPRPQNRLFTPAQAQSQQFSTPLNAYPNSEHGGLSF